MLLLEIIRLKRAWMHVFPGLSEDLKSFQGSLLPTGCSPLSCGLFDFACSDTAGLTQQRFGRWADSLARCFLTFYSESKWTRGIGAAVIPQFTSSYIRQSVTLSMRQPLNKWNQGGGVDQYTSRESNILDSSVLVCAPGVQCAACGEMYVTQYTHNVWILFF